MSDNEAIHGPIEPSPDFEPPQRPPNLHAIRKLSRLLDTAFRLPGTEFRFGLEALIGLIPGVGDTIGALLSTYILLQASRLGVSRRVLMRMVGNILLDTAAGIVPVFGDLFDASFKANIRNLHLLEAELHRPNSPRHPRSEQGAIRTLVLLIIAIAVLAGILGVLLVVGLIKLLTT